MVIGTCFISDTRRDLLQPEKLIFRMSQSVPDDDR